MNGTLALALVLLFVSTPVRAQTGVIAGRVEDESAAPIPGAQILLEGTNTGTAAEDDGGFLIAGLPPGEHALLVSALGFQRHHETVVVVAGDTTRVRVALTEQPLESAEVIVTAVRRPQASVLVPLSVSVLSRDDLLSRNVRSLDEALRYVPGVQMAENQVNIRGSSGFSYNVGSRVLLLVDGVPLLGPETGGVPFDALPMPQVARIEVVKGPGSALYGSGALGGIINVITRDFPERPETSVSVFAGVHDPVRHRQWRDKWSGAEVYRGLGGGSFTHARRFGRQAGGWLHAAYRRDRGYLRLAADEVFQAYAKLGWEPTSAVSLRLLGGITARERDAFLYWGGIDDPLNPGNLDLLAPGSSDATGTNDNRSIQVGILPTVRHALSPRFVHTLRLRYFLVQIRPIDEFGKSRPLEKGTSGFRFGGEWQLDWSPSGGGFLTAGISADANAARSEFFRGADGGYVLAQPEFAAFAQYERQLGRRWSLLGGLRLDAYQIDTVTTSTRLSPRFSLSYSVASASTIRASFGRGFRVPGIAERYIDNQDFFPFFPNHRLRPELSTGYEIGYRLERPASTPWLNLDAALFWNDFEGLVEPTFVTDPDASGTARPGFQFVNVTRARIRGGEVSVDAEIAPGGVLKLAYTFLWTRDLDADQALAFRSPHLLKTSLDWSLTRSLRAGVDYRFSSKPQRVDSDFAKFVRDAELMVSQHVVDVRASWSWSHFVLAALVTNALDYYYVERPAYLAPPRQFVLQVRADI
ncbi:MAG TPA: TonB-dependent receptor [Rhodothermales bacterium]